MNSSVDLTETQINGDIFVSSNILTNVQVRKQLN